jgi:hypothetical protein
VCSSDLKSCSLGDPDRGLILRRYAQAPILDRGLDADPVNHGLEIDVLFIR